VSGGPGVLEAAALVDRDVHQDRVRFHVCDKRIGDQLGSLGARHQHGTDHQVGFLDSGFKVVGRRVAGLNASAELSIKFAQSVDVDVEDRHVGAHSTGDSRAVVAGGTA